MSGNDWYGLEHSVIITEGAMRLHIFLVDYREDTNSAHESVFDKGIFENEYIDNAMNSMVTENYSVRLAGRISNEDNINRKKVLYFRDNLKLSLATHDMPRPKNDNN